MNRYILLNMFCVLFVYASDEPLDTSSAIELSREQGVVSVLYKTANGILEGGNLTIKLHEQGINYLRTQDMPLRISVLLNRDENNISLLHDEYCFASLAKDANLVIMKEAIDVSINKGIHAQINKLPQGATLYLSYVMSSDEAKKLNIIEEYLEEIDAQERSPIVKLRRLLSQEYKGPL